jgi:hypothetical protein
VSAIKLYNYLFITSGRILYETIYLSCVSFCRACIALIRPHSIIDLLNYYSIFDSGFLRRKKTSFCTSPQLIRGAQKLKKPGF